MKIYVKNMACESCKVVVKEALEELDIKPVKVELGEIETKEEIIEVRTEQVFNYTPEQVYDAIKSVDTLDAEKPFLMSFDLPVPTK